MPSSDIWALWLNYLKTISGKSVDSSAEVGLIICSLVWCEWLLAESKDDKTRGSWSYLSDCIGYCLWILSLLVSSKWSSDYFYFFLNYSLSLFSVSFYECKDPFNDFSYKSLTVCSFLLTVLLSFEWVDSFNAYTCRYLVVSGFLVILLLSYDFSDPVNDYKGYYLAVNYCLLTFLIRFEWTDPLGDFSSLLVILGLLALLLLYEFTDPLLTVTLVFFKFGVVPECTDP